jgi:hypothetical protein
LIALRKRGKSPPSANYLLLYTLHVSRSDCLPEPLLRFQASDNLTPGVVAPGKWQGGDWHPDLLLQVSGELVPGAVAPSEWQLASGAVAPGE